MYLVALGKELLRSLGILEQPKSPADSGDDTGDDGSKNDGSISAVGAISDPAVSAAAQQAFHDQGMAQAELDADGMLSEHFQPPPESQYLPQYYFLKPRAQGAKPPPGTVGRILTGIEEAAERGAIRSALAGRRMAYVAGLTAAAGAATTAGVVVVLASRSRGNNKVGLVGWPLAGRVPQAVSSLPGAILTRSPQGQ